MNGNSVIVHVSHYEPAPWERDTPICAEAGLALDLLDAQIRAATPPTRRDGVRFIREMKPGETWTPLGNGRLLISHPNNPVLVIDVDALEAIESDDAP